MAMSSLRTRTGRLDGGVLLMVRSKKGQGLQGMCRKIYNGKELCSDVMECLVTGD